MESSVNINSSYMIPNSIDKELKLHLN